MTVSGTPKSELKETWATTAGGIFTKGVRPIMKLVRPQGPSTKVQCCTKSDVSNKRKMNLSCGSVNTSYKSTMAIFSEAV